MAGALCFHPPLGSVHLFHVPASLVYSVSLYHGVNHMPYP
jgi:hypothetical protein